MRSSPPLHALCVALIGTCAFANAQAQTPAPTPTEVAIGAAIGASLDPATDAATERGNTLDVYRVRLSAGQRVEIIMTGEVSPFLTIGRDAALGFVPMSTASGEGQARVLFEAPQDGVYDVRATGNRRGAGAYNIEFRPGRVIAPPPPAELTIGASTTIILEDGGPRALSGHLYRDIRVSGSAGARYRVVMTSTEFGPDLEVGAYDASNVFQRVSANVTKTGDRSIMLATLPDSGVALIRARPRETLDTGSFTLAIEALPPAGAEPEPIRLPIATRVNGTLSMADAMISIEDPATGRRVPSFAPYAYYELRGRAGETFAITMDSDQFDTVLEVGAITPAGFAPVIENDDYENTNSRVSVTFERTGSLIIRASAFSEGDVGEFTLFAEPSEGFVNRRSSIFRFFLGGRASARN